MRKQQDDFANIFIQDLVLLIMRSMRDNQTGAHDGGEKGWQDNQKGIHHNQSGVLPFDIESSMEQKGYRIRFRFERWQYDEEEKIMQNGVWAIKNVFRYCLFKAW
jgi:hypothetical protein